MTEDRNRGQTPVIALFNPTYTLPTSQVFDAQTRKYKGFALYFPQTEALGYLVPTRHLRIYKTQVPLGTKYW